MKCECGKEFEGNFCPQCGKKVVDDDKDIVAEVALGGVKQYRDFRLKWIFLGAFVVAIFAFWERITLTGIVFTIIGILLLPPVFKRFVGKKKFIPIVLSVFLAIIGIIEWQTASSVTTVDYVKQYQDPDAAFSIGEFMEMAGDVTWICDEQAEVDYVTAIINDGSNYISVIFMVDDYPELYDVLLNDVSNAELYYEFDSRLFGNGDAGQLLFQDAVNNNLDYNTENTPNLSDEIEDNSTVDAESNSADEMYAEQPDSNTYPDEWFWYETYNLFLLDGSDVVLEIVCQNDIMLEAIFSVGTESLCWIVDTVPTYEGSEGSLVYRDTEGGFDMTYVPEDNCIIVQTSDGLFSGSYYPY